MDPQPAQPATPIPSPPASSPPSGPPRARGPSPLPPPRRSSPTKKTPTPPPEPAALLTTDGTRKLPTDPTELEKAIAVQKIPAGMLVSALSHVAQAAELEPFNKIEQEQGTTAIAAVIYENEAKLTGTLLVLMWLVSVAMPRIIEYVKRRREEQKKAALPQPTPPQVAP